MLVEDPTSVFLNVIEFMVVNEENREVIWSFLK